MAVIEQRGKGWRARVRSKGEDRTATFRTKAQAQAWVLQVENEIATTRAGKALDKTFGEAIERYITEVLPGKRGERSERLRLQCFQRSDPMAKVRLPFLGAEHVSDWRDRRLKQVTAASVLREWNALSAVCTRSVKEWRWMPTNPFTGVKRPATPAPRTRVYTDDEIERVLLACGYPDTSTQQGRVGACVLFALETAMRASEIVELTWDRVFLDRRIVHLPLTKNGSARDVPLSRKAMDLLESLRELELDTVFGVRNAAILDALWRKARDRAMLDDAHFHDLRATALTRMAQKVGVMDLAKISGHRDLRILQNTYYRVDPSTLASKLD